MSFDPRISEWGNPPSISVILSAGQSISVDQLVLGLTEITRRY